MISLRVSVIVICLLCAAISVIDLAVLLKAKRFKQARGAMLVTGLFLIVARFLAFGVR